MQHFVAAYEQWLAAGAGNASQASYHKASNVTNDNSIYIITNSLTQIQLANNTYAQMLNDNMSTIMIETRELWAVLADTKHNYGHHTQPKNTHNYSPPQAMPKGWMKWPWMGKRSMQKSPYQQPTTPDAPPSTAQVIPDDITNNENNIFCFTTLADK